MRSQWLRRWLLPACASALLLAACGGGSIESSFTPARVVAFGDAMGDLGQTGRDLDPNGRRYTTNDGTPNIWTQRVANSYGRTLAARVDGGLSFATGNARVVATPDAAGNAGTPTVQQQIDAFLASNTLTADDLVLVSVGSSDVVAEVQKVIEGVQTETQMLANIEVAARAAGDQVRRLVDAGAEHVAVAGVANLGRSPWAIQLGRGALMESASTRFNQRMLVTMVDLGADVLYIDAALEFNLATSNPGSFSLSDVTTTVCNSVDAGAGIGTGTNQVNSKLCTPSTLAAGADHNLFLWADRVYPTSRGHQILGDFAFTRIRERW